MLSLDHVMGTPDVAEVPSLHSSPTLGHCWTCVLQVVNIQNLTQNVEA